jgi:hypothetical protein
MFGVRNSTTLLVIAKKPKRMSVTVSRFSPKLTSQDIKKSLEEPLKLFSFICNKLKTKFNIYASFHISVNKEDFHSTNNTGAWSNTCLISSFLIV